MNHCSCGLDSPGGVRANASQPTPRHPTPAGWTTQDGSRRHRIQPPGPLALGEQTKEGIGTSSTSGALDTRCWTQPGGAPLETLKRAFRWIGGLLNRSRNFLLVCPCSFEVSSRARAQNFRFWTTPRTLVVVVSSTLYPLSATVRVT